MSWYNRYSLNSTVGPIIVSKTVLYGGTYGYQNECASKLALVDPAFEPETRVSRGDLEPERQ